MNERYERDLRRGQEFQDHVVELFARELFIPLSCFSHPKKQDEMGENLQGIEIKFDDRLRETGNLFIEYRERSGPTSEWHDSGILGRPHVWGFAIGDYQRVFFFSVRLLVNLKNTGKYKDVSGSTARGYILPQADAEKYATLFLPGPVLVPFSQRETPY